MNLAFGRCRDINGPLMEAALALYRSSFPAHELRLPPDQRDVMGNPLYHFDMCLLDGALAGLILYWDFGTYIYVEHFCVEPSLRGHGLGTLLFNRLCLAERACGAQYMSLFTGVNNPAQRIYQAAGFTPRRYFAVMIKEL